MRLLFLVVSVATAWSQSVEYRIQSGGENRIALEVEKTGMMKGKKHLFEFPRFSGKFGYDAQNPSNSHVELKIESASVTSSDAWLGPKDLKKVMDYTVNDVLQTKTYPEMRFQSTKITAKGGNQFSIEGTLTIRGNAKMVVMEATLDPAKPVIDGKSVFKLSAYGINPPSAGLGTAGTKNEVTATFHIIPVK